VPTKELSSLDERTIAWNVTYSPIDSFHVSSKALDSVAFVRAQSAAQIPVSV